MHDCMYSQHRDTSIKDLYGMNPLEFRAVPPVYLVKLRWMILLEDPLLELSRYFCLYDNFSSTFSSLLLRVE